MSFLNFTFHDGKLNFTENHGIVLPQHPDTLEFDLLYLPTLLKHYGEDAGEILDAFPILAVCRAADEKFYHMSFLRLKHFISGQVEQDLYVSTSIKHLFMADQMLPRKDKRRRLLDMCLERAKPEMCQEHENLNEIASYIPTKRYSRTKLVKGYLHKALHYIDYCIVFVDPQFVGYDNFESIVNLHLVDSRLIRLTGATVQKTGSLYSSMSFSTGSWIASLKIIPLLTSPNNDNERDAKVMLFRDQGLVKTFEQALECFFIHEFRLNDVFKWNRYTNGGVFHNHFDTMFVKKSASECSLFTMLFYVKVDEPTNNFIYLSDQDNTEVKVPIQQFTLYVIPHWVKHRVEGSGFREFIKNEIIFKNKSDFITYDQTIVDAFDHACYYMLHSVRHPQLKNLVSQSFNLINEARFFKTKFTTSLVDNLYIMKTIKLPLMYSREGEYEMFTVNYITNGLDYFFKCAPPISRNQSAIMTALMHLDIHPNKLLRRQVRVCLCNHKECEKEPTEASITDIEIKEKIFHWFTNIENTICQNLSLLPNPGTGKIYRLANVYLPEIYKTEPFYFAACQNLYEEIEMDEDYLYRLTIDTSIYAELLPSGLVKIKQKSFQNGIQITEEWRRMYNQLSQ